MAAIFGTWKFISIDINNKKKVLRMWKIISNGSSLWRAFLSLGSTPSAVTTYGLSIDKKSTKAQTNCQMSLGHWLVSYWKLIEKMSRRRFDSDRKKNLWGETESRSWNSNLVLILKERQKALKVFCKKVHNTDSVGKWREKISTDKI